MKIKDKEIMQKQTNGKLVKEESKCKNKLNKESKSDKNNE